MYYQHIGFLDTNCYLIIKLYLFFHSTPPAGTSAILPPNAFPVNHREIQGKADGTE